MNDTLNINVTHETFDKLVIQKSDTALVVIIFLTQESPSCQELLTVISTLVQSYDENLVLTSIDAKKETELSRMFGIRSVPSIKFMRNGELVGEFTRVPDTEEIREKLDLLIENESDNAFLAAFQHYKQGHIESALLRMYDIVEHYPKNITLKIQLVSILLHEMRYSDAATLLESLPPKIKETAEVKKFATQILLAEKTSDLPSIEMLTAAIENNTNVLQSRLDLSTQFLVLGEYQLALDQLLLIITTDRKFQDGVGEREILQLLELLGTMGDTEKQLANQYRQKLAQLLH